MPGIFEKNKNDITDTDLSWDSPHHTLGNGKTQAAPGNHGHEITEIKGLLQELNSIKSRLEALEV